MLVYGFTRHWMWITKSVTASALMAYAIGSVLMGAPRRMGLML